MKIAFGMAAGILLAGFATQANAQASYDSGLPRSACGSPAATCGVNPQYNPGPIVVDSVTTQSTREAPRRRKRG